MFLMVSTVVAAEHVDDETSLFQTSARLSQLSEDSSQKRIGDETGLFQTSSRVTPHASAASVGPSGKTLSEPSMDELLAEDDDVALGQQEGTLMSDEARLELLTKVVVLERLAAEQS